MWGALGAVVKGLASAFFQWWATYDQGRKAQQLKDLEASLAMQQKVDEAARLRTQPRDRKWLHDGSPGVPTPARPAPRQPPAPHL